MIVLKIDVTKIEKERLFVGKTGAKYLDAVLFDNKDGEDQYGNLGFVVQSVSKEEKERGERGPIIGNWKEVGAKQKPSQPQQQTRDYKMNSRPATKPAQHPTDAALNPEDVDDVPF
jgi:hypothetical protein